MLHKVVIYAFLRHWLLVWPVLVAALLLPVSVAGAQGEAPVTLSDVQVNQIVKAVTGAVLNELKASPPAVTPAPRPPAPSSNSASADEIADYLQQKQYEFFEQFNATLRAYPALADHVGSVVERVDGGPKGRSTLAFLGFVAAILAIAVALAYGAVAAARRLLPGTEPKGGAASITQTLRRATANLIGVVLFWTVTAYASDKFFHGLGMQGTVGQWLLMGAGQFALYYTLLLIWFRPAEPAYRIVPLEGADAKLAMRLFVIVMAVVVLRSWISIPIGNHQPASVIAAGLLINNLMFVSSFFAAALPAREAIRRWIETTAIGTLASPLRRWFAMNWLVLAGTGVLMISAVHAYGAVTGHVNVVAGLTSTVQAVVAMVLVCAVAEFVGRRSERANQAAMRAAPKLPSLVSRMLRVLILLGAAVYFIRLWAVDALQAMTPQQWEKLADFAIEPLAALFAGYLAVSYVNYYAVRYLATHPLNVTSMNESGDLVSKPDGSSRLRTLIPIIRITANVIIIIMIALLVLSQLGFNITPLLAGASVIGLAISFGSQALVKDIVTGVLFLAEDAFRIGEYIVCGNASGTVEGFTLRSVRLRHSDGQIFTVPFGQIGEIVNFSRDWSTVNFTMSLDRDADLDDIRRATAQVAHSLKTDFKNRLLDSLTVQGVKDVTDTAIVVQFKFTALPHDPGEIERVARSRLLKAFKDDGIALSRPTWFTAGTAAQPA